jgi:hypothetical protein
MLGCWAKERVTGLSRWLRKMVEDVSSAVGMVYALASTRYLSTPQNAGSSGLGHQSLL